MGRYLSVLSIPLPHEFRVAIDLTLQGELAAALSSENLDPVPVGALVEQIRTSGIQLDTVRLEFTLRGVIEELARKWRNHPGDMAAMHRMEQGVDVLDLLPFNVNLWAAQNLAYDVVKMAANESISARWRLASSKLALRLGVAPA
jgi:hypothetical protein